MAKGLDAEDEGGLIVEIVDDGFADDGFCVEDGDQERAVGCGSKRAPALRLGGFFGEREDGGVGGIRGDARGR